MSSLNMETLEDVEMCFPHMNRSCLNTRRPLMETSLIYCVLSCIIVLTVFLNLLVIISISHFRQLHTATNFLLLSLAVADFLVGLLEMPGHLHNQGCWLVGDRLCAMYCLLSFVFISISVGSMVLISMDRYIAICKPMFYTTRVTLGRVKLCVCLCWMFSFLHASWILRHFLQEPQIYYPCYGNCDVPYDVAEGMVDLVVSFVAPILIIAILYSRVFVVAVSQARAMRSHITAVTVEGSQTVKAKKSEMKAARTLGIVIVVFLICTLPLSYYCFTVEDVNHLQTSFAVVEIWCLYLNSTFNPVIYVFFYPWFRKSIKHIFTLQILQPGSSGMSVM